LINATRYVSRKISAKHKLLAKVHLQLRRGNGLRDDANKMIALIDPVHISYHNRLHRLVLHLIDAIDLDYSFRATLAEIKQALDVTSLAELELPCEKPREDYVEGTLRWNGYTYSIYFERMLSYMQFSSESQADVQELHDVVAPICWCKG
jgi:hypothetical protein